MDHERAPALRRRRLPRPGEPRRPARRGPRRRRGRRHPRHELADTLPWPGGPFCRGLAAAALAYRPGARRVRREPRGRGERARQVRVVSAHAHPPRLHPLLRALLVGVAHAAALCPHAHLLWLPSWHVVGGQGGRAVAAGLRVGELHCRHPAERRGHCRADRRAVCDPTARVPAHVAAARHGEEPVADGMGRSAAAGQRFRAYGRGDRSRRSGGAVDGERTTERCECSGEADAAPRALGRGATDGRRVRGETAGHREYAVTSGRVVKFEPGCSFVEAGS
mmetsp:Transcript_57911/g.133035  ORF Transcript_57911/g.133035 Transcript_57911/m.133035 type:complete len:279 (+) Transcript_57911:541-1377(+)